jgi:hypothetical protein
LAKVQNFNIEEHKINHVFKYILSDNKKSGHYPEAIGKVLEELSRSEPIS